MRMEEVERLYQTLKKIPHTYVPERRPPEKYRW